MKISELTNDNVIEIVEAGLKGINLFNRLKLSQLEVKRSPIGYDLIYHKSDTTKDVDNSSFIYIEFGPVYNICMIRYDNDEVSLKKIEFYISNEYFEFDKIAAINKIQEILNRKS
jgi:hypothetical protein